nr:MAG TPA: hypothetical protein [Caudoviricetes sp.]
MFPLHEQNHLNIFYQRSSRELKLRLEYLHLRRRTPQ